MDVREKLVEWLCEVQDYGTKNTCEGWSVTVECKDNETIADHLIASGVTVQERKPLEAFLHPIDAYKGLKEKYLVFKADTRKKVDNCFVLRPDRDPAATEALRAYANASDNETLAEDIYNWVGKGEKVQEWISVKDRLPEHKGNYLGFTGSTTMVGYYKGNGIWWIWLNDTEGKNLFTHWMPLPPVPEEE